MSDGDVTAYITREEIKDLVLDLLGITLDDTDDHVTIDATTINGSEVEPITIHRAYRAAAEQSDKDDFNPDDWPELFNVEYDPLDELVISSLEVYEPDEDRRVAEEIIQQLCARFDLGSPTIRQARETERRRAALLVRNALVPHGCEPTDEIAQLMRRIAEGL